MFESKKNLEFNGSGRNDIININSTTMPQQLKKQQDKDTNKFNDFIQGYIQKRENKVKQEKKYDRFIESKKKGQMMLME